MSGSSTILQDRLKAELANSSAALEQTKHQGAKALADTEAACRQAVNKANDDLDNWKERVAQVRPCMYSLYMTHWL